MSEARIGPHEVKRTLVVGPGLELAETLDAGGRRLLLQILRLRPPSNAELDALRALERRVAKITTTLFDAFSISTHAGVDAADGTRILFWTLPWPGHAFFDLARGRKLSEAETLETARLLIERARRLQNLGVRDPALYEGALLVTSAGVPFDVAGLPITAPQAWLHRVEPPLRWLAEEASDALSAPGDLFRIAHVLTAISAPSGLSVETRALLAKLADRAYVDLDTALAAVRRLQENLLEATGLSRKSEPAPSRPVAPAVLPPPTKAPEGPDWGAMFGDLDDTLIPSASDRTEPPATRPAPVPSPEIADTAPPRRASPETATARAPRVPAIPTQVTVKAAAPLPTKPAREIASPARTPAPLAAASLPERVVVPSAIPLASSPGLETARPAPPMAGPPPGGPAVRPRLPSLVGGLDEEPIWADADLVSDPSGRPMPLSAGDALFDLPLDLASASSDLIAATPIEIEDPAPVSSAAPASEDSSSVVQALAVQTAAWAPPVFAEGASPWSEIVETQGAHRRPRGGFPGYEESLPGVVPEGLLSTSPGMAPIAPVPVVAPVVAPPPIVRPVEPVVAMPPVQGTRPSSGAPKLVAGVVAILVVFGAVAALMRGMPEPIDALESLVATPANQVTLDSQPSGAKVVAEADGRLLGRTPMEFLVPSGANAAVLVAARGYEPQRVVLPDRGALELQLSPLPAEAGCEIELEAPDGLKLEGLETPLGESPLTQVPGSMVVRAAEGQAYAGARLVRCPELGGRSKQALRFDKRWAPASLRISAPAGTTAFVDGESAGPVPVVHKTGGSFSRVKVVDAQARAVERWVPSRTETEVQMTSPAARVVDVRAGELPDDVNEAGESEEPTPIEPIMEEAETRPPPTRGKKISRADRERVGKLLREGNRLLLSGQVPRAQSAFEACLKIDEGTAACHRSLGTLHRRQNDKKKAKRHLGRYVDLAPDAPDVPTIRRILKTLD